MACLFIHKWDGCKCMKCHKTRHVWKDNQCLNCGAVLSFYCFAVKGKGLGGGMGFSFGGDSAGGSMMDRAKSLLESYDTGSNIKVILVQPHEWDGSAKTVDNGGGMFSCSFSISDNVKYIETYLGSAEKCVNR